MSESIISTSMMLNYFRTRVSWPTMQNILHSLNLPVGQGWDKTIEKLDSFKEKGKLEENQLNSLEDAFFENLLVGEKALKIYNIPKEKIEILYSFLSNYTPKKCVFTNKYPYPLNEDELKKADLSPHLVEIEPLDDGLALIYCTKRFIIEKQQLDLKRFDQKTKDDLQEFDEIIAVKHNMKQCYDIIKINNNFNVVKVLIDSSGNISNEDQIDAFNQIIYSFNKFIKESDIDELSLGEGENLFPLLNKLYNSPEEGRVCEIAFITDESSVKHERMRRKEFDLRTEEYHKAGRSAVDHITPYRLGVCWNYPLAEEVESKPEILLAARLSTLNNGNQYLSKISIYNCTGFKDYNFVITKIRDHLNELATQTKNS